MLLTNPLFYLLLFFGLALGACLFKLIFWGLDIFAQKYAPQIKNQPYLNRHGQWIIIWLFLILCWWPVFMSVYPGFFCFGAGQQLSSFIAGTYNVAQPLLHTFLLGASLESFFALTGSYNSAIAIFISLQIVLITGIFTFTLYRLNKLALHFWFKILILLYYAFSPVLIMFGISTVPETLFAAFVLLFVLLLIDYFQKPASFWYKKSKLAIFVSTILLMLAFRFNPQVPLAWSFPPQLETSHFCPKLEIPARFNGQIPFLQQIYWQFGEQSALQKATYFILILLIMTLIYVVHRRQTRAIIIISFLVLLTIFTFLTSSVFSLPPFLYLYFCLPIMAVALFYPDEI